MSESTSRVVLQTSGARWLAVVFILAALSACGNVDPVPGSSEVNSTVQEKAFSLSALTGGRAPLTGTALSDPCPTALATAKSINGINDIDGKPFPASVGDNFNNQDLAGKDCNNNGVRDDVERRIARDVSSQAEFNSGYAIARITQKILLSADSLGRASSLDLIADVVCRTLEAPDRVRKLDILGYLESDNADPLSQPVVNTPLSTTGSTSQWTQATNRKNAYRSFMRVVGGFTPNELASPERGPKACTTRYGWTTSAAQSATTIMYVNGVNNTIYNGMSSSQALIQMLSTKPNGPSINEVNFTFFWNATDGLIGDTSEVAVQRLIEQLALTTSLADTNTSAGREAYYAALATAYSSLALCYEGSSSCGFAQMVDASKRVLATTVQLRDAIVRTLQVSGGTQGLVLVPHSQGNLYVEAAYAMILSDPNTRELSNKIRVIGVAVPAISTASVNSINRYVTIASDAVIDGVRLLSQRLGTPSPLPWTDNAFPDPLRDGTNCPTYFPDPKFHNFVNTYLCERWIVAPYVGAPSLPDKIFALISASLGELKPAWQFVEDFNGSSLDSATWSPFGASQLVSNGIFTAQCGTGASTQLKRTLSGDEIIVETRMAGPGAQRDAAFLLIDAANPSDYIQVGDTTYGSLGLYSYGSGAFGLAQVGNHASTTLYMEYRLTLKNNSLKLERGSSLSSISQTVSRTMGTSIAGRSFYLVIGANNSYCPTLYDWLRASGK